MATVETLPTIPDNAPIIEFDVALGKKYSYVEFDYDAYALETAALGLSEKQAEAIKVQIVAKGTADMAAGYHKQVVTLTPSPKINNHLAHELTHASDVMNGKMSVDNRYLVGRIGGLGLYYAGAPLIGATVLSEVLTFTNTFGNEAASNVSLATAGTLALFALGYLYGYQTHPGEVRARKSEKDPLTVIKLTKRV